MTAPELLRVDELRVEYITTTGDVVVVDDVSFSIRRGDIFGLAGESGSGKTTIAQGIMRLLKAPAAITGGRVLLDGEDVLAMDDEGLRRMRWRKVAWVAQSAMNALNPVTTIGEQIAEIFEVHDRMSRKRALEAAGGLLELVGIRPDRLRAYPHELSGGMRQRVVIAMALALKPPLLIMDEPTTALDVVVQREILAQIGELQAALGFSVLFITHDLSLMLELCSHIGILYAGRLIEAAPAAELFARPSHPYTQALLKSFPSVHARTDHIAGIGGTPPDLRKLPAGCAFQPRCSQALPRCVEVRPNLLPIGPDHTAACHLCP
jgi:peptide/nickel transport system ATP-binding protein